MRNAVAGLTAAVQRPDLDDRAGRAAYWELTAAILRLDVATLTAILRSTRLGTANDDDFLLAA
jgi:hypothetical protein